MKKFAALCFALSAPLFAATSEQIIPDQEGVKLSGLSVACYGTAPGKCKSGSTSLSYKDFVNQLAGKPAIVQAVYYFKDRDDKVLLEYAILEDEYAKMMVSSIVKSASMMGDVSSAEKEQVVDGGADRMAKSIVRYVENASRMSNASRAEKERFFKENEAAIKANCPGKDGCQELLQFLRRVAPIGGDDKDSSNTLGE